jgi:hypothetical protein
MPAIRTIIRISQRINVHNYGLIKLFLIICAIIITKQYAKNLTTSWYLLLLLLFIDVFLA